MLTVHGQKKGVSGQITIDPLLDRRITSHALIKLRGHEYQLQNE
jgi:hypothetical protein